MLIPSRSLKAAIELLGLGHDRLLTADRRQLANGCFQRFRVLDRVADRQC